MALQSVVVCPDVVGNRSFCIDGVNCFRPAFEEEALLAATETALGLAEGGAGADPGGRLRDRGPARPAESERAAFHEVLDHLDDLYENG